MPTKGRLDYQITGIGEVLRQGGFVVPTYQRSYAWDADTIDDFWTDLKHAIDTSEPDYFLGTLVFASTDENQTTVIDGQQRLATTTLFLAAIRNIFAAHGSQKLADDIEQKSLAFLDRETEEREPTLLLNEDDQLFFRNLVIERKDVEPTHDSHKRLKKAFEKLQSELEQDVSGFGTKGIDRLKQWLNFIEYKAMVITVTVPSEADAFVIFETLNDRGAALTIGDLLKNYLFGHSGSHIDAVKKDWAAALSALDITAENEMFVSFLRHHWSSKQGAVRERDLYKSIKDEISTPSSAAKYSGELATSAHLYAAILAPSHSYWSQIGGSNTVANAQTLVTLELEQYRPLLLAVMQHFSNSEVRKTIKALVDWSVRGLVVGGIGGGRTEKAYCEAAILIRSGKLKTSGDLRKQLSPIIPTDDVFENEFKSVRQTKARIIRYMLLAMDRYEAKIPEPELVPNPDE
jgi:hypothetical protein